MADTSETLLRSRIGTFLFGPPLDRPLPERLLRSIREQEDRSEVLICWMQIVAIVFFAILYGLSPKGFGSEASFAPVPITLAAYAAFTALRLFLAYAGRLTPAFLATSVLVDIAVLMITIWSFHLQYNQPPAVYLKAPTLLYVFIIVALRALRFDPRWVLLAGLSAAAGWLVLLAYALWGLPMSAMVTRNYAEYATSNKLLIGAEIDKIVSILIVTAVLALVLVRARRTLIRSVADAAATAELSRFFAPDIAQAIIAAPEEIKPGTGVPRQAAIMFIDLRGFTTLASTMEPTLLVEMLGQYQSVVLPVIRRHRGAVITYLGDGIMITFGATRENGTFAADAVKAAEELKAALADWAARRKAQGQAAPAAGIGVAYGRVIYGAIGTEGRLEYAVIGDPVNRAARLQGLTKAEGVAVLVGADAWAEALAQGLAPKLEYEHRSCTLAGISEPVDVVALR